MLRTREEEKLQEAVNAKMQAERQDGANFVNSIPMPPGGALGQCGQAFSEEGLLNHLFSYHSPYGTQTMQYQAIREAAKYFAKIVLSNTPKSADQSDAIRKIREAVMTANASIALGGVSH